MVLLHTAIDYGPLPTPRVHGTGPHAPISMSRALKNRYAGSYRLQIGGYVLISTSRARNDCYASRMGSICSTTTHGLGLWKRGCMELSDSHNPVE